LAREALAKDRPALCLRFLLRIRPDRLDPPVKEELLLLKDAGETALTLSAPSRPVDPSRTEDPLDLLMLDTFQEDGRTIAAGKIQNRSLRPLAGVSLNLKAFGGKDVYEREKKLELGPLDSGEARTFSCLIEDPGPLDVEIAAEPKFPEAPKQPQESSDPKASVAIEVVRAIKGNRQIVFLCSLENQGPSPCEEVVLAATFYDAAGNPAHKALLEVPPPPLKPGESRLVELTSSSWVDFHAYKLSLHQASCSDSIH